jgi:hypothetical protein
MRERVLAASVFLAAAFVLAAVLPQSKKVDDPVVLQVEDGTCRAWVKPGGPGVTVEFSDGQCWTWVEGERR